MRMSQERERRKFDAIDERTCYSYIIQLYIFTYICIVHISMCVCIYIHTYVYIYIHIHTYKEASYLKATTTNRKKIND